MKLSVRIKDGKFIYDYNIGSSSRHGETPLSAEQLVVFSKMLEDCCRAARSGDKYTYEEIVARAYMTKFRAKAIKFLKEI